MGRKYIKNTAKNNFLYLYNPLRCDDVNKHSCHEGKERSQALYKRKMCLIWKLLTFKVHLWISNEHERFDNREKEIVCHDVPLATYISRLIFIQYLASCSWSSPQTPVSYVSYECNVTQRGGGGSSEDYKARTGY